MNEIISEFARQSTESFCTELCLNSVKLISVDCGLINSQENKIRPI